MSTKEIVKFITKEIVNYVDTPTEERKSKRKIQKEQREGWSQHWFGQFPLALQLLFKRNSKS